MCSPATSSPQGPAAEWLKPQGALNVQPEDDRLSHLPSCGYLVRVNDETCYNFCSRAGRHIRLRPLVRQFGQDFALTRSSSGLLDRVHCCRCCSCWPSGAVDRHDHVDRRQRALGARCEWTIPGLRAWALVDGAQRVVAPRWPAAPGDEHDVGAQPRAPGSASIFGPSGPSSFTSWPAPAASCCRPTWATA